MALVGYSDSEESSGEDQKRPPSKAASSTKPAFQKVVDRSNPRTITVNLPESSKPTAPDGAGFEEPPAKRAKLGAATSGGFNALLPAPKRATATATSNGKRPQGKGPGAGVNLKTGSAPGFSREPEPLQSQEETRDTGENFREHEEDSLAADQHGATGRSIENESAALEAPKEPKKVGSSMMFMPLSVARKPQKKKVPAPAPPKAVQSQSTQSSEYATKPYTKPKVSLFSMGSTDTSELYETSQASDSRTAILDKEEPPDPVASSDASVTSPRSKANPAPAVAHESNPQSLSSIAEDLNLSASARRQLFGRKGDKSADANVVNFNTDAEYQANQAMRAAGEQQAHNPVRAIAPGKHSLKQLVNAVSSQKDALEEQFASGKRNRKEAGSKYGW